MFNGDENGDGDDEGEEEKSKLKVISKALLLQSYSFF